jgi:hypothetical protein
LLEAAVHRQTPGVVVVLVDTVHLLALAEAVHLLNLKHQSPLALLTQSQ